MEVSMHHSPSTDSHRAVSDQKTILKICLSHLNRFFISAVMTLAGTGNLGAQDHLLDQPVTLPDTTCTIETALKIIEEHTGLSFSYNSELVSRKKIIDLSAHQDELIQVLRRTFGNPQLNFRIIGRHIVVYQSEKVQSSNPDSREDSVYILVIRGRILDKTNLDPLPYSSIYLAGKGIGTVTNNNGQFLLKLSSQYLGDTLTITCIGYKQIKSPVYALINSNRDFLLKPDVISIQEVIIRKIDPVNLLQSATESVYANYPQKPAILTSFYRELIKKGSRYMMVSEAILENFKSGYRYGGNDQVKILKGRKSTDVSPKDTILLKLKAGLNTMLMLDVVKNMPLFLTGENQQFYDYRLSDIVLDNGRDQYAIEFNPKAHSTEAYYSGRILLDVHNLAFTWVEFYVDPQQLNLATSNFIIRKPPDTKVKVLKADYKIAFKAMGNKYYLSLIQCEMAFRIRDKKQISGSVYNTSLEMAVTDIDTVNAERFRFRETARLNEFFTDQLGEYDESFWGEYNFISPSESLEEALVRLSKSRGENH
jgi:hypothetical protein